MKPRVIPSPDATGDALGQYVASVRKLNTQLHRISVGEREIAGSLSRAAAALRSIAAGRAPRRSAMPPSGQ